MSPRVASGLSSPVRKPPRNFDKGPAHDDSRTSRSSSLRERHKAPNAFAISVTAIPGFAARNCDTVSSLKLRTVSSCAPCRTDGPYLERVSIETRGYHALSAERGGGRAGAVRL